MNYKAILTCVIGLQTSAVAAAPLEDGARYNADWSKAHAQTLADDASMLIRRARYRCDTVSSITSWVFKPGFTVTCNGFRYKYEIEDKGGRWTVTLQ